MPMSQILAGRNLLTERPVPDKRFSNLSMQIGDELGPEGHLVGLTYITKHRSPRGNPILVLAGDDNKKLYFADSVEVGANPQSPALQIIAAFDYPTLVEHILDPQPAQKCYGIATLHEAEDCVIAFISEPQIEGNPVLYHLRYDPQAATDKQLVIDKWFIIDTGGQGRPVGFKDSGRGLSEYRNDLLAVGTWKGTDTILQLDYYGMPLAYYPAFTNTDKLCGVQHINGRVYTTIDMSSDPDIGSRVLAKFLTEYIDKGRMVPLMSIEPFFLNAFNGEITLFQDRMAACYADMVYTFRMCYFMFIVDELPNDDIDMGSVLIGDEKIKRVVFKNIADIYKLKDVIIKVDRSAIKATKSKEAEACDWVMLTTLDPANHAGDPTAWGYQITLATTAPYIEPDGEREFWLRVRVPEEYSTILDGTTPVPVTVDDGPFVVPLVVRARVG